MSAHRQSVKVRGPAAAAAFLVAVAVAPGAAPAADAAGAPAGAVAEVGGRTILLADLEGYLRMRPPEPGPGQGEEAVRRRLEELVLAEALYAEALRRGVDREPDVRQAIRQVVVQRLLEREVDRPAFERTIAEEELKQYYEAHRADYVRPEQARAADVFLAAPAGGDPAVRERKRAQAEAVLAEAQRLQDTRFGFGELVLAHSDAPAGRPKGDTGYFDREGGPAGIPRELAEALFSVDRPGSLVGAVVAGPDGFHVAMLTGRRAALSRPFEDQAVRREIEERVRNEQRRRAHDEFVRGVRAGAAVSVDESALGGLLAAARAAAKPEQAPGGAVAAPGGSQSQAPPSVPEAGR